MPRPTTLLLAVLGLSACAPADRGLTSRAPDPTELIEVVERYNTAWERVRPDEILTFHAADFEYYWFDQRISDAFETILREEWLADVESYSIDVIDPSIRVLGPDAAVVSFVFSDVEVSVQGDTTRGSGALAYVMERIGGEWRISRVHHAGALPDGMY